jgi:hypothetical protein
LLVVPFENSKLFNLFNFNDIGLNSLQEANSFKKIKMFSKIYNSDLYFQNSYFLTKYKKINSYLASDDYFFNASALSTKRQHNFLSSKTFINKNLTYLDVSSLRKLVNYNFKNNLIDSKDRNFYIHNLNSASAKSNYTNDSTLYSFFVKNTPFTFFLKNNKTFSYAEFLNRLNNDSDKKMIPNAFVSFFNKKNNHFFNSTAPLINKTKLNSESFIFNNVNENSKEFLNKTVNIKKFDMSSSNQAVLLPNRNVRNFITVKPNVSSLNNFSNINNLNYFQFINKYKSDFSNTSLFKNLISKNIENKSFFKLARSRLISESPLSPIPSSNLAVSVKNYDNQKNTHVAGVPTVLQGKEEVTSNSLTAMY